MRIEEGLNGQFEKKEEDNMGVQVLPLVRDFKWVCAGSMSEIQKKTLLSSLSMYQKNTHTHTHVERERERESRVCLERPLFHSSRQTDTYSLTGYYI